MATAVAELIDREVKRDEQGRRITPAARRAELVAAYRSSGLTMVQFARREGIHALTLAKWSAAERRRKREEAPVRFAEFKIGVAGGGWAYEVVLASGMTVRAASAPALVALLELIRK